MATTWILGKFLAARSTRRPILPKPLIPTLIIGDLWWHQMWFIFEVHQQQVKNEMRMSRAGEVLVKEEQSQNEAARNRHTTYRPPRRSAREITYMLTTDCLKNDNNRCLSALLGELCNIEKSPRFVDFQGVVFPKWRSLCGFSLLINL